MSSREAKSGKLTLFAVALFVGCSGSEMISGPPRDDSAVQTDSLTYHLQRLPSEYRAYVIATFTNHSNASIYFARCDRNSALPMFGVRRTGPDSTATLFHDWAWACVGGVPTGEILPGATISVRVPVGSMDQPNMYPPLKPEELVGLMRVEISFCKSYSSDSDYCDPLPQAQRSSNAFLVTY